MSRTGIRQTGWQLINGKFYYFYPSGVMAKGKIKIGKTKWPLRADGSLNTKKKKAPGINVVTAERRHTTK
jgi:glucan-binding YG repeat protein